jgi:hypothetical protein
MRLRQVALVARDLESVVSDLCAVLGIAVAFRDPGVAVFGLHNAVMPVGDTFLEVVSPAQAETTAGRYLERRGGDGGYMVLLQCDDLDADRAPARLGVRVVELDLGHSRLPARDVGRLSLDAADPRSLAWAGPDWKCVRTDVVADHCVELRSNDPLRWHRWSVAGSAQGGVVDRARSGRHPLRPITDAAAGVSGSTLPPPTGGVGPH